MQLKLYTNLAYLWHIFSPHEDYAEEAETFHLRFQRHGISDGASILHLGSGGGSLDYNLRTWYRVVGVDLSPEMINQAQQINPELEYVHGDIREIRLGRLFDAVVVHDAIAYMTSPAELHAVYGTAAAHLRSGGVMLAAPEELRERLKERRTTVTTRESGGLVLNVMESCFDPIPDDHEFEVVLVFLIRRGEELQVEVDRHRNGVFTLEEFLAAVRSAGFSAQAEEWELSWGTEPPMPLMVAVKQ